MFKNKSDSLNAFQRYILVLGFILIALMVVGLLLNEKQRVIDNCKSEGYFAGHSEKCMRVLGWDD